MKRAVRFQPIFKHKDDQNITTKKFKYHKKLEIAQDTDHERVHLNDSDELSINSDNDIYESTVINSSNEAAINAYIMWNSVNYICLPIEDCFVIKCLRKKLHLTLFEVIMILLSFITNILSILVS